MIIEFIILAGLIGGIVYAATRWDELEARLFPKQHRPDGRPTDQKAASDRPDATSRSESAKDSDGEAGDDHASSTTIAKGFMRKKDLAAEPEVDSDDFHKTQGASETVDSPTSSQAEPAAPSTPSVPEEKTPAEPAEDAAPAPNPAADYAANPTSSSEPSAPAPDPKPATDPAPKSATPGGHVTGAPARPSQPAYVNASSGVEERVEDLAAEADAAYRDRDYEKAEQACLKILMREPKNHKYMTRIGQIYQEMGQLDDAKEAFETAKKLDPKNFFVLNRLAEVERLLNDRGGRTSENKGKRPNVDEDE